MRYDFTENVSNEHLGILLEVENIENAWLALKARVLPTAYNLYLTRERKTTFQDALEEIKEAFDFYESITHHNTPQDDR